MYVLHLPVHKYLSFVSRFIIRSMILNTHNKQSHNCYVLVTFSKLISASSFEEFWFRCQIYLCYNLFYLIARNWIMLPKLSIHFYLNIYDYKKFWLYSKWIVCTFWKKMQHNSYKHNICYHFWNTVCLLNPWALGQEIKLFVCPFMKKKIMMVGHFLT